QTPWLRSAADLYQEMVTRFYDSSDHGYFTTTEGHETLFGRSKPVFDQPVPSGNALAIRCGLRLGDIERSRKSLEALVGWMERAPGATESLLVATLELLEMGESRELSERVEAAVGVPQELQELMQPPAPMNTQVEVEVEGKELMADPEGIARTQVIVRIPEGVHLNSSTPPARWLVPTRVSASEPVQVHYPEAVNERYEGEIRIPIEVRMPSSSSALEFELKVEWQACTETECLPPKEKAFGMVALRS
ncbi:MAG TPA: protein-disulfide reductase DsbD domain-containing protein, partial [Fimbriimonadaceae bacterium]|nr:protein-disulfide reductase DsbD domain-containing protein [Fimbriimonadaceae bacterium]